ncbi:hypothetical protein HanPI659440_Chr14g0557001 [Helianthus annuus]|nr:hypothetical protein HanPI659440_Chr14g0557001 [Helianthus annuus]
MTKPKSKKQALIGNFFKRKFEEINDNESSPNVGNDIQANDDVDGDASPNVDNGDCSQQRTNAKGILSYFKKLEFVFYMHLMGDILSYTNALSKHLQQKGKDLLEAANLINGTKRALNALRQNGFEPMLEKVTSFCKKYNITMLDWSESYGNPRKRKNVITNRHHFEVDIFNEVLDMQIQELGSRFSEVTTTLIKNMSGLNPSNGFSKFDPSKILAFAKMYPDDLLYEK